MKKCDCKIMNTLGKYQKIWPWIGVAGYAIDDEENELGIRCVALAVPGMNGRAEAAFSISGLAAQMTDDRIEHLARMGLAARQDILRDLGWK